MFMGARVESVDMARESDDYTPIKLHETLGLSLRMTDAYNREIWAALEDRDPDEKNRSARGRELLGMGVAADNVFDQYAIEFTGEDAREDRETFVERAVRREVERVFDDADLETEAEAEAEPTNTDGGQRLTSHPGPVSTF